MTPKITLKEISIRTELRPGDIGYVTYMHGHLYQKEYGYGVSFEAYVAKGLYEFYKNYDRVLDCVWVAEHDEKIIGFLLLMHRQPGEAQLRYFIIAPTYRGIGLGKKLAQLFLAHLEKNGYQKCYLWTTDELFTAANIYRTMGFKLTEEILSTDFGKPLKEQRYDMALVYLELVNSRI
jgi:ribosomal protein S18 acetylase RimI-like enzyme